MKNVLFWLIVFAGNCAQAHDYTGVSLGGDLKPSDELSSIFELNYVGRPSDNISIFLGWAWRNVGTQEPVNGRSKLSMTGTQAGFLFHPSNRWVRPYIGLGLYSSRVRLCNFDSPQACEDEGSLAVFPEAGIQISVIDSLQFSFKVRDYRFDREYLNDDKVIIASLSFFIR